MSKRFALLVLWITLTVVGCSLPNAASDSTPTISGAPVVQLASPLPNATYLKDVIVNIQALVSNAGEGIDRVEISVDDTIIATVPSPNPSNSPTFSVTQTFPASTAGTHTISVTVFRTDGSSSTPATATINVLEELPEVAQNSTPVATTENSSIATEAGATQAATTESGGLSSTRVASRPTSTNTVAPTTETQQEPTAEATAASNRPIVKTRAGGLNVRRGPSANFVPALGVLAGNQTVDILAYNPNGTNPPGIWYKIPFGGGEGWIYSGLVDMEGDLNLVPIETGPAIPTLAPATAAATTAPAATTSTGGGTTTGVNLVMTVTEFRLVTPGPSDGSNIFANEAAFARVNVTNNGTVATSTGVIVAVAIANKADPNAGSIYVESPTNTGILAPGQSIQVDIPFTDNTAAGIERRAVIILDPGNAVAETNENDNMAVRDYVLGAR